MEKQHESQSETLKAALIRTGSEDQVDMLTEEAQNATKTDFLYYFNSNEPPVTISPVAMSSIMDLAKYRMTHNPYILPWEDLHHVEDEKGKGWVCGW